jgi:hypothetical protein
MRAASQNLILHENDDMFIVAVRAFDTRVVGPNAVQASYRVAL